MQRVIGFILMLFVMSCHFDKTIGVQGHRGCRGLMPENTIPAFEAATKMGVQTLELDVVVSKDHVVVVSHEPFMSQFYCLNPEGKRLSKAQDRQFNLYQMTFDSIQQFDCGSKYYPQFPEQKKMKTSKPSLEAVIQAAKAINPYIKFNIELKAKPSYDGVFTPKPDVFVSLVLDVVNKNNAFEATNLQSFDLRILEETKRQAPSMTLAILVDANEEIDTKLNKLSFNPEIISPYFKLLTRNQVQHYQDQGYKVIPWTVNKVPDLKRMINFGVDAIITDYPNKLINLLSFQRDEAQQIDVNSATGRLSTVSAFF